MFIRTEDSKISSDKDSSKNGETKQESSDEYKIIIKKFNLPYIQLVIKTDNPDTFIKGAAANFEITRDGANTLAVFINPKHWDNRKDEIQKTLSSINKNDEGYAVFGLDKKNMLISFLHDDMDEILDLIKILEKHHLIPALFNQTLTAMTNEWESRLASSPRPT